MTSLQLQYFTADSEEIWQFYEAKVERSVNTLMEFESHLKFKRDVRYQSVWRESSRKESQVCKGGFRAQVFEVLYNVSW